MLPADVDRLVEADLATLADHDLAAPRADINQHVNFLLIFTPSDESLDAAVHRARFEVERFDNAAAAVKLFDEVVDFRVLRAEHDHFLPRVHALPNFTGV